MDGPDTPNVAALIIDEKVLPRRPYARICTQCRTVFDNWDNISQLRGNSKASPYMVEHHENLTALKTSATAGCNLCERFILGRMAEDYADHKNHRQPGISRGSLKISTRSFQGSGPEAWNFILTLPVTDTSAEDGKALVNPVFSLVLYSTSQQALMYDSPDESSISTRDALLVARRWLNSCLASHTICNSADNYPSPTRLLDVSGKNLHISLVSERAEKVRYATLSHCWGTLPVQTLKRANLDAYRKQIPSEALTKTFQDAIHTTKYLGLKYLWIDSLCIVQDDDDDWRKEAALMSSVYGGSTVNISASNAPDGRFGCFQKRDPSWRCQIEAAPGVVFDCVPASAQNSLRNAPLGSRGWVLQERVLSRRNIHFARDEIFWECEGGPLCETFPEKMPQFLDQYYRLLHRPLKGSGWNQIIGQYSSCKLTFSKDKLIAMSGMARAAHEDNKDLYVAGMWRHDLETQLCWYTYTPAPRLSPYAAPTWSWASSSSPINVLDFGTFGQGKNKKLATVQSVDIDNLSSDPFGQIRSATLRLCCEFIVKTRLGKGEYYPTMELAGKTLEVDAKFDCLDVDKEDSGEIYVVPIIKDSKDKAGWFFGILVEPTSAKDGEYRRVGQFAFMEDDDVIAFMEWGRNCESQVEGSECVEVVVGEDGLKRYVIDVV